ncbi:MAG: hypothetical protein ACUZ8N_12210, partial [Candidatus Scalindua sp.]
TRPTDADAAAKANAQKSAEAAKENANATKSNEAAGVTTETRPTDADDAAKANAEKNTEKTKEKSNETSEKTEKTEKKENGNVVKAGKAGKAENGNVVKAEKKGPGEEFGQMVNFFNNIDKMINGLADKAEGKDGDKGDSLLDFASRLSDMFTGINKAFGKQSREEILGHRLGMTAANKETIGQLFDNGHGSGAINRIGDAGEGTGNFNAVSFMSSISNGINDALESYKDIQRAEKEAKEEAANEESKEAVGVLA